MSLFSFLKSNEEKAQLNLMNIHFAIISFKPDGTIIQANENFLNTMGYTKNEIIGKHHRIFCDSILSNSKEYNDFWNNLNKGLVQTSEFKRIKKNKESVFLQASYTPVKDKKGQSY